jgi:iron complex outermembrane recepter protein
MYQLRMRSRLLSGAMTAAMALASTAALGQTADPAPAATQPAPTEAAPAPATAPAPAAQAATPEIVVTGSVFRRRDLTTPSPVTVVSAKDLQARGITTASDAVLSLASSGGGGLPNSFSANGAFASGASGVSLRGLTTDSTLVLVDGQRLAYYPLADDGARSFVDLNTIPNAAIDRVEVLKDGASATYGADAIAGVVNYILKKQITGISGTVEGGISQRHDAGHQRMTLTAGYGDLDTQNFNFWTSVEYQHDAMLKNKDRGFPYNTSDLSRRLADDGKTPDTNSNVNGQGFALTTGATSSAVVVPATLSDPSNILSGQAINGGLPMVLNPAGCGAGTTLETAGGGTYCSQDKVNQYGVITPEQTRFSVTSRFTVNLGGDTQAYLMGTYYQNRTYSTGTPYGTDARQPLTIRNIVLPALLANGSINPQDPYANIIDPATGQRESALLKYSFGGITPSETDMSRTYRIAGGAKGSFGDGWRWNLDGTYMHTGLDMTRRGLLNYGALENAITTGSYNFIDPSQNSQAQLDALSPTVRGHASSDLWQVQGLVTKDVMELPGGMLQLAVGGQVRYEKINDPNQDPLDANGNYTTVGINTFEAQGHRYNESGAFELNAPLLKQLEVDVSGRYDHYSEGFSHFSPKVGVKITPIRQVILRGTFSKGFRAPSIPETQGAVIGYVTTTPPQSAIDAHGGNGYVQPYSLGEFTQGNPNLKPELSTNFTVGTVLQPTRWLSVSVDYYHIKKKNVIVAGSDYSTAIANYYNGAALPAGYAVETNPVDPANPNAIPTIQTISASYENANSLVTSGLDMQVSADWKFNDKLRLTSTLEATRISKFNISTDTGTQHYVGTVGQYNVTSASGTPRWRANWQNTLQYGKASLTATAYYTSGYRGTADDYALIPAGADPCDYAVGVASDGSTSERCHVKHFIDVDLTASYKVNDKFSIYTNIINLFDAKAPFDPNTYGGNNYNPAWSQAGVVGRFFRIGANFGF